MAALPEGLAGVLLFSLVDFLSCFLSCIICVRIAFFAFVMNFMINLP